MTELILSKIIAFYQEMDITGIKTTDREIEIKTLDQNKNGFHKLLHAVEQSPVSIILTDYEGKIEYVNPKFLKLTGYPLAEVIGKNPRFLKSGEMSPDEYTNLWETIRSGNEWRGEFHNKKKNGELYWELASISPIKNSDGTISNFIAIKEDITERKRIEKALQKSHEKLEERVAARTQELSRINELLENEIDERKLVEKNLQEAMAEVEQLKNRFMVENIYLKEEINIDRNFENIISESEALQQIIRKIQKVAITDSSILIVGETGTGKELFAHAIHNISSRKEQPLVVVNCAVLPANLIESELFGHERGAFTGAVSRKIGRFELANNGTIFLDEIGDLPVELQAKLLRVLEAGEFERLGNPKSIKVNVRVIAATNHNLENAVQTGNFREDLFYRLNVFPVSIPPLRDRKEDISPLVKHFTEQFSAKLGKNIHIIPQKVMNSLAAYFWPGNVRELRNIIERAVILSPGSKLQLDDTFELSGKKEFHNNGISKLEDVMKSHIVQILKAKNWIIEGISGAAVTLDINPGTLRSRMKKLGIRRPG